MKVYPVRQRDKQNKIELMLKATNKRDYLLWLIGTNTGLRISDILKLKVKDVQKIFIELIEQKTGKRKRVKINSKLAVAISDYCKDKKPEETLFPSRNGVNKPISIRRFQQVIKKIAKLVGVTENINSHSMRKTFALNLYNASKNNIALVMEALNHSKEQITLRYLCLTEQLLDDTVELLACL